MPQATTTTSLAQEEGEEEEAEEEQNKALFVVLFLIEWHARSFFRSADSFAAVFFAMCLSLSLYLPSPFDSICRLAQIKTC